ncbi:zinc ribbon domain-containing protein [Orrella marina]|uniref:Zinc ribbon domain-containing protein n=1 Tax=Orrella marina TaxID=2163011 RepID=A0A2R4XFD0_9BURK|nr:zinc ribbon domain-containing protein [Orrella marina]AWB32510.1 zinc ribbon domain-containing protein [Orrella marina]
MKQFKSLHEAAEYATSLAGQWSFANSDAAYAPEGLLVLAQTSDAEDPIDEDSVYVVSDGGSIGLCEDEEDIDWLFIADQEKDLALPDTFASGGTRRICNQCGQEVEADAHFCDQCGASLN